MTQFTVFAVHKAENHVMTKFVERRKGTPVMKKSGEANGKFGALCNKLVQVGGAGLVVVAVPALIGIVWQNHTASVQANATLAQMSIAVSHMVGRGNFESEINRLDSYDYSLESVVRNNHVETTMMLLRQEDVIRAHTDFHLMGE